MARAQNAFQLDIQSNIDSYIGKVAKKYHSAIGIGAARAINKSMARTRTYSAREMSKRMGIPNKGLKRGVTIAKKAHRQSLSSGMRVVGGRPPNVIRFSSKGATQVSDGVMHGAWQKGAKMTLAKGAFLMPHAKGKAAGRSSKVSKGRVRSGSRRNNRRPVKKFTATAATHFVAKRKGRTIKGVWGTSPAMNFMWKNKRAGQKGVILGASKKLTKEFPEDLLKEITKEVQRQSGLLTFQRGGGVPRKQVVRRNRRTGKATVRSVKAITVGRLPG
jgi:hypothetical protein